MLNHTQYSRTECTRATEIATRSAALALPLRTTRIMCRDVQTLGCLGYHHTDVLIPFQIVLDNQTQNFVRADCFEYLFVKGEADGFLLRNTPEVKQLYGSNSFALLTNQLDFTKTIIPLAPMASESIAIDSEPFRARGIIVKCLHLFSFWFVRNFLCCIRRSFPQYFL